MAGQQTIHFTAIGDPVFVPTITHIFRCEYPLTVAGAKAIINGFLKGSHFVGFAAAYKVKRLAVIRNETGLCLKDDEVLPFSTAADMDVYSYFIRPKLAYSAEVQYAKYVTGERGAKEVEYDDCMKHLYRCYARSPGAK
jgi:hypothetical protein